jgi:DNA-binding CsgD family transcriptional regulator
LAQKQLSQRQLQVMRMYASGMETGQIAEELGITPSSVRNIVRIAKSKLGADTRSGAIQVAQNRGLL